MQEESSSKGWMDGSSSQRPDSTSQRRLPCASETYPKVREQPLQLPFPKDTLVAIYFSIQGVETMGLGYQGLTVTSFLALTQLPMWCVLHSTEWRQSEASSRLGHDCSLTLGLYCGYVSARRLIGSAYFEPNPELRTWLTTGAHFHKCAIKHVCKPIVLAKCWSQTSASSTGLVPVGSQCSIERWLTSMLGGEEVSWGERRQRGNN